MSQHHTQIEINLVAHALLDSYWYLTEDMLIHMMSRMYPLQNSMISVAVKEAFATKPSSKSPPPVPKPKVEKTVALVEEEPKKEKEEVEIQLSYSRALDL